MIIIFVEIFLQLCRERGEAVEFDIADSGDQAAVGIEQLEVAYLEWTAGIIFGDKGAVTLISGPGGYGEGVFDVSAFHGFVAVLAYNLVFAVENKIPVKDTLFTTRENFKVKDLKYIPFSEGDTVIMRTIVKQVSGVDVPLFEAQMPYWSLLKGMDHQQIVNLVAEREDTDRFPGLMVGSIENANNNAGNWE